MDIQNRFNKWNSWLDKIENEVTRLVENRYIFWEVQKIIKNNPKIQKPSAFYEWLGNVYATSAVIGIRRQIDERKDVITLARLLHEIMDTPQVITRRRFISLYKNFPQDIAHKEFDRLAGRGGYVDPAIVREDLRKLRDKSKELKKYANRRIAHFDRSAYRHPLTFREINQCLNFMEKLVIKYIRLFRAAGYESLVPVFTYDWKKIFKYPWIL